MDNISKELLQKYNLPTLDKYISDFGDTANTINMFYLSFLNATDYICNKIVEGVATWDDYTEEKVARQFAREHIINKGEIV